MNDMTGAIEPKSDQINADDLIAGDLTITITGVKIAPGAEQPVSIQFAGSSKVFRPCKSMSRVLVAVWGADANRYIGRSLKLYRDPDVTWGGMKIGGIRIREMSDMEGSRPVTLALTDKRGSRKPTIVKPLVAPKPVDVGPGEGAATIEAARTAAAQGTAAFREWWGLAGRSERTAIAAIMGELKAAAEKADATTSDPFGLPPLATTPTPEQLAAAEAEAIAAANAQNEETE